MYETSNALMNISGVDLFIFFSFERSVAAAAVGADMISQLCLFFHSIAFFLVLNVFYSPHTGVRHSQEKP